MWIKHIFLGIIGGIFGMAVAGGAFALITALTVVPRLVEKSKTAKEIIFYENILMVGGVVGCILSVYPQIPIPFGRVTLVLYGLFCGIQVGCLVMALTEIMNVFPMIFRRLKMQQGLQAVIFSMAIGKLLGGLWYFYFGMGS